MKKLTVVAIALAGAFQAQAAEVYKNDTTSLDLYGRIYAGQFFGDKKDGTNDYSAKQGANQFVRFGAKADSQINSNLKALAQYEVQLYVNNSEKTLTNDSTDNLRTRLAFAGVTGDWGTLTFGRQKGAMGSIEDWTDVAYSDGYGADGTGVGTDTFGTNRAASVLKYSGLFGGLQVDTSYKFDSNDTETPTTDDKAKDSAYGAAVSYTFPFNLSLGTAYNVGHREAANTDDAKLWLVSAKFDNKALYAAFTYADGQDFLGTGIDHTGYEAVLGYSFANGFGLQALWNKQKQDNGGVKKDNVDYYTLAAQYKFNKQLRVIGEYRINNLDDTLATTAEKTKDDYSVAVRYDF